MFYNNSKTAETQEVIENEFIDVASNIKSETILTGVEAHDVSTSNANDNDENGGVPTPPPSSEIVTIEGEATMVSSTTIIDDE